MQLRYNYRLDPRPRHRAALGKAFGCARVVFNDGLAARREAHQAGQPYLTDAELSARLTAVKATPRRAWLNEVSAVVLQQALADLNTAYHNYFASLKGTRKGPKIGLPRFRSRKDTRQAIRFTANARFTVLPDGKLRLPKIGDVPVRWSRPLPSEPSSVTVIRDSAGRYFASFVVQTDPGPLPQAEPVIGIDLGLKHFAVLSDGRKIASPRFFRRAEKKLRRAQRSLSRKQVGSANREKARAVMAAHGFGPNNRLKLKLSTRNLPTYRDASVILISQLKEIYIDAELQLVETAQWVPKLIRRDYALAVSQVGNGVDDPDQNYPENYACGSRTYMDYCNKEIDALIAMQSAERDQDKRKKIAWEIDRKLTQDAVRPMIYYMRGGTCWRPEVKNMTIMVNSIFNGLRMEDVCVDR